MQIKRRPPVLQKKHFWYFFQADTQKKQRHKMDYIYFKPALQPCEHEQKWFWVSSTFNIAINTANTFSDCLLEER